MNYLTHSWHARVRKASRYVRLYGPRRTWIKILGQYHMKRRYDVLPVAGKPDGPVGLIGCGNYAFATIAYYLHRSRGRVIGGCMDIDPHRAASLAEHFRVPMYTADAAELIEHPSIGLVYIASNHASHAEYAIQALDQGKDVFIEKPHVVSHDQLRRLVEAMDNSPGRVYLGFNRPISRFGRIIRCYLQEECGPAMYSWFVAGHRLGQGHWYRRPEEGGRVLGNLCHWTDFLYCLQDDRAFPVEVRPTRTRKPDSNIAVTLTFADESIAALVFSEKDEPFEGIKERFSAHRGRCLIGMEDFQQMTVEVFDRKRRYRNFHRDHGHRINILDAFDNSVRRLPYDRDGWRARIANTALLFLGVKESLENNMPVRVEPYSEKPHSGRAA